MSDIFDKEKKQVKKKLEKYPKIKWIIYISIILIGGLITIGGLYQILTGESIISLIPNNYSITKNELKEQTLGIRTEIIIFANEREKNQPQIDFSDWKNSTDAYLDFNKETQYQWELRFASKVQFLYGEFKKRNMRLNEMTELLIENPGGSTSWMKTIAIELGTLAYQL